MLPRSALGVLLLLGLTAIACNRGGGDSAARLRDADTAMNDVAAQIEERLSGDAKQRFVEAERAWLTYRDANCDAVKALHDGSSDQPSAEAACLARLTDERRAELERVYKRD